MSTIQASWKRIEQWLEANAEELFDELQPPAPPARIAKVEQTLGVTFPDDFRESLAIHDGQRHKGLALFDTYYCLRPLVAIPAARDLLLGLRSQLGASVDTGIEAAPGVRPVSWHEKWVPILEAGVRQQICLDLDPSKGGHVGQLVRYELESDKRDLVAPSFEAWLEAFATKLGSGQIRVRRDRDGDVIGLRDITEPRGGGHDDEDGDDA